MRDLGGNGPSFVTRTDPNWSNTAGGPGDRFVASKAYQRIADPAGRGQTWTSGPVEVSSTHMLVKGTMLETGVGGPGGGMVPPLYQPGVVDTKATDRSSRTGRGPTRSSLQTPAGSNAAPSM